MNRTSNYELTIIVPVYNEEDNMCALEEKLSSYVQQASVPACILFVNDGSTDHSLERMMQICHRQPHFFYCSLKKNGGLSAAMKAGIDQVESKLLGYIDADLQTDPEDFERLLPYAHEYELVMGIRANRKDSFFKNLQSKIANGFRRMMTKDRATDTGQMKEVPVRHYPRVAGVSKYHLWNSLVSPFLDCFAYRWMKKRYINYQIGDTNLSDK